LLVRIYPDEIVADGHEAELTDDERAAGTAYWQAAATPGPTREHELAQWGMLVQAFSAPRAAWIVQATAPAAAPPESRPGPWTRAVEARVLPDRWVLLAYRGEEEVLRYPSPQPIHEPLALTLHPYPDQATAVTVSQDGLQLDPEFLWTVDFARAEAYGMALRVPLTATDLAKGFDRLLVVGVKASLAPEQGSAALEDLLQAQHYTNGLAFVAQGTPTNNTRVAPAGVPPDDPGGSVSFAVERGSALTHSGSSGALFTQALGVHPQVADHLAGADGAERQRARAMNNALWPVSWGYFLDHLMAPEVGQTAVRIAREHYVEHVCGRGPLPAFRVGGTPYGPLPASSLTRWQPGPDAAAADLHLPPLLRALRGTWQQQTDQVPRVDLHPDDPDADLLRILAMEASTQHVRLRTLLGPAVQTKLLESQGISVNQTAWFARADALGHQLMQALGHPEWQPLILRMLYADSASLFRHALVTDAPLSEQDGLAFDYIRWIRTTLQVGDISRLRQEQFPQDMSRPTALLYRLLRHAALSEWLRIAYDLLQRRQVLTLDQRRELELVGIEDGTEQQPTAWDRLLQPVPQVTGARPLGTYLAAASDKVTAAEVAAYLASLRALEGLPTAELQRLCTETLDTCSHRLDAWITSLASKRLLTMRQDSPLGSHLGAYGWVVNLRPAPPGSWTTQQLADGRQVRVPAHSGGYIQAPSPDHAAAAAVLRNAYLTHSTADQSRYAIDLSSRRVRLARWLLDSVREGQPMGAVLGYRFERGLHDRQLDQYIEPLRQLYPLVTDASSAGAGSGPQEVIPARDVVNGLRLRDAWRAGAIPFGSSIATAMGPVTLPASGGDRGGLEAELAVLDDAVDGVADVLTAETVYQAVRGNTTSAAATLDAMAQGVRPPDPEVARAPRSGTTATHRVAVVLGGAPMAPPSWTGVAATPRALAEPYLDGWIGSLLGDPQTVRCRIGYRRPGDDPSQPLREQVVTLDQLGLRPLDVVALSQVLPTQLQMHPQAAELDQRVAAALLATTPDAVEIQISYARDQTWRPSAVRTFPELLELARATQALLGVCRPLRPADVLPPQVADSARAAELLAAEALQRAQQARARLASAAAALQAALSTLEQAPPGSTPDLADLRRTLASLALHGVAGAYPRTLAGATQALRAELVDQTQRVLAEANRRVTAADSATSAAGAAATTAADQVAAAVATMQALFGDQFLFLPRFRPVNTTELSQALAAGPALVGDRQAPRRWLQQASRVHLPLDRWRRVWLYAEALGAPAPQLEVAQLPHATAGARWVALAFPTAADRPPSGLLSLVLHRPAVPAAEDAWVGLLLHEWTELIPATAETTGVAFHYEDPGAEAPQAVLIAVPPTQAPTWSLSALADILNETLTLAQIRGVDLGLLGALGQVLPAIYVASNAADDTVSTDFSQDRRADAQSSQ
jgi:hypothetical protein